MSFLGNLKPPEGTKSMAENLLGLISASISSKDDDPHPQPVAIVDHLMPVDLSFHADMAMGSDPLVHPLVVEKICHAK